MNGLIERYIYDVTRRLPEKIRGDVKKELYSNIEDMLPDDPTEDNVYQVLSSLGDPKVLAEQYRPTQRYLISPALFDEYLRVLKLVATITSIVLVCCGFFSALTDVKSDSMIKIFLSVLVGVIANVFTAVSTSFLWVTVSFAIADYCNLKKHEKKEWAPESLPQIPPASVAKISRSEVIVSIIFSIFFAVIFIRYPNVFSWYELSGESKLIIPFFNDEVITRFVPIFLFVLVITLFSAVAKLIYGRWNFILAGINAIQNIASTTFTIFFLSAPGLINNAFTERFANTVEIDKIKFSSYFERGIKVFIVFIIIFTVVDIISCFYKAYKNHTAIRMD